jgi:hypothetical protein
MRSLMAVFSLVAFCACSTPTIFTRTIEVRKDADGNVVETVVTETVSQPNRSAAKINMEYIGKKKK